MQTISIHYDIIWRHKEHQHYVFDAKGECYNQQRGKLVKKTYSGRSIGYYIAGKFINLKELRKQIEKIPDEELPF
jgi:hypothetical protein